MSITTIEPIDPPGGYFRAFYAVYDYSEHKYICNETFYVSTEEEADFVIGVMEIWAEYLLSIGVLENEDTFGGEIEDYYESLPKE